MISEGYNESDQRKVIGFLALVYGRIFKPFEELLGHELTNLQIITLCTLSRCGPTPVTELAHLMHIPKQQMTKVLSKLGEEGYIRRLSDDADRRVVLVELTEETDQLLDERLKKLSDIIKETIVRKNGKACVRSFFDDIGELRSILEDINVDID